jgi:hypothetical protein
MLMRKERIIEPQQFSSNKSSGRPEADYVELVQLYLEAIENAGWALGSWHPIAHENWIGRLRERAGMVEGRQSFLVATLKNLDRRVKRLEAGVEKEEQLEVLQAEWPAYAIADFQELTRHAEAMRNAVGDASQVLFHTLELETLLERAEQKARNADQKYEGRLAATLRDICRVHDPGQFTEEQASCLKGSITALVEGWGRLTREKLKYVRTHLLDVGLTWLPVTDKALSDLKEAAGRG